MFLEYVSLIMLIVAMTAVFYVFIFIHDIPYEMAKKRNHPQAEVIHYGCWLSLFTLHAIWPLVFLWAVSNRETTKVPESGGVVAALTEQVSVLQQRVAELEQSAKGGAS
jgi:hypothetical protein